MAEYSPMMQHYLNTKADYPDCILFYRLGDFYEMFFDDAINVSKELELTLTGKLCGQEERAPMCGVPFHAADVYISKLVGKGYKVAVCEQVEDPKLAKGIVKREVTRIITPGTNLDTSLLDESKNNYIMSVYYDENGVGLAICDVTTGDFMVTELADIARLLDEIAKFSPSEIVCSKSLFLSPLDVDFLRNRYHIAINSIDDSYYADDVTLEVLKSHFNVASVDGLGLSGLGKAVAAAGSLLKYLSDTQKNDLGHIINIKYYTNGMYMLIDAASRRNLELTETMREKNKKGSLLWVLDKTKTAMGARMLRNYVEQPLIDINLINDRLDAIEEFNDRVIDAEEISEYLTNVYDLERIIARICYDTANPRDMLSFRNSIELLPAIKAVLSEFNSKLVSSIRGDMDTLEDLYELLLASINEDAPLALHDGKIIKEGYNDEVDRLRLAKTNGNEWLMELEAKEREKTGIKTLKIKKNNVFGYFIEVTNSFKELVPAEYTRKQTLANAERFITPELKELEDVILSAEEKLTGLEYELFSEIRTKLKESCDRILRTARLIAHLDATLSLSKVSRINNYVRPVLNNDGSINIKNGRHPVVEKVLNNDSFIPNDTILNKESNRLAIITGPNMAGKSTYMRQTALIVLMAQVGSFVPATSANISICDRIFTRVGASDDLSSGQSTFMVEMNEVANILRNATSDSLIILDEIGRGTSTFDGLSIAWAVAEHIADPVKLGAKTLFATHYHELTELEGRLDNVNNYQIAVKESGDNIIFLRKIIPGGADKSYGIQVAKLAGVPDEVTKRAKEVLKVLIDEDLTARTALISNKKKEPIVKLIPQSKMKPLDDVDKGQISLFDLGGEHPIITELKGLDLTAITPIEALNILYNLQKKL